MKAPDAALLRARAKAPLADLQALHLSSADLAIVRHLEGCHRLRSLYANANVLKDIDGLLPLRGLWHIDLSDNLLRQLQPLASFPALGFLHLGRNQLGFGDLVCLRDVHILDLRLSGNQELLATDGDRLATIEFRMKVVALLPYAWTLDGHYVTTHERAQALEVCDAWVVHLLARHSEGPEGGALRFGSTSDLWRCLTREDDVGATTPIQEDVRKLLAIITKQPTRNPEQQDLYRLRAISSFHDNECGVHNAHAQFAPQKHSPTAKPMAAIRLKHVQTLPRRVRLEIGVLLAVHLDFPVPTKLLTEALTLALLASDGDTGAANATVVHDLALLPPYAVVALVSALRLQALEDHDTSRTATAPVATSELRLWKTMPAVIPTLLQSERQSRLEHNDVPDQLFLQRCAFAVSLLSRAAAFPSKVSSSSPHGELFQLIEAAKLASTASLESLGFAIPNVLVGDSSSSDMPWKKTTTTSLKHPEREYRKPWSERAADTAPPEVVTSERRTLHGVRRSKSSTRRLPKPGEWLEVSAKCFFKIRSVSADGEAISASPVTDARGAQITLRVDHIARVSSSLWRLTATDEPHLKDEILQILSQTPLMAMKSRLGKLHRDAEGFHRHGASRNQGFPNYDVSAKDLHGIQLSGEARLIPTTTQQPQPVEVFSATDTLDANYVLASPALISVQNAVAAGTFREQRRVPAGLWNPIETPSFHVTQATDVVETPVKTTSKKNKTDKKRPVLKRQTSLLPPQAESEDDWLELQREMQAVLGIRPRTPLRNASATDGKCFMTAGPGPHEGHEGDEHLSLLTLHDSLSSCASTMPSGQSIDESTAKAPRSSVKSHKLESLVWHQVATKPQLLVAAAASPLLPPRRSSATSGTAVAGGGGEGDMRYPHQATEESGALDASPAEGTGARPGSSGASPAQRAPLRLTRCHVSLPTLSLDSQKDGEVVQLQPQRS